LAPGGRIRVGRDASEVLAEGVVAATQLGIRQHVVGLGDVLEPLLGLGVLVDVGVVLARQPAVGPLDVGRVGIAGDSEDLVEVLGHQDALVATTTAAGRRSLSSGP
jgi:hypothetical protein